MLMKVIPLKSERVEPQPSLSLESWILRTLDQHQQQLRSGDILVISSKIVSFFEDRLVRLNTVTASEQAIALASKVNSDPRLIEVILREADEVIADSAWVLLTRKNGILSPNAGIDTSNVPEGSAILWPEEAFATARSIRQGLEQHYQQRPIGVLITDCVCQPGRSGTTAIAIGYAGLPGFQSLKDSQDLFGNTLRYAALNIVDSLATAANLLMGEGSERRPIAIIRDYTWQANETTKNDEMNISPSDEMFPLG